METVKNFAANQLNEFTKSPADKTLNFAINAVGYAVVIWFASGLLNFAARILISSYAIVTSAF